MAIKPPNYQKDAIPTKRGWTHPKSGELLVSTKINQSDIDKYLGVTPTEPEAIVIDMTADVEQMVEDMGTPGALVDAQRADLEKLSKLELEAFGREHGIELDRRFLKSKMVDQLLEHLS